MLYRQLKPFSREVTLSNDFSSVHEVIVLYNEAGMKPYQGTTGVEALDVLLGSDMEMSYDMRRISFDRSCCLNVTASLR